MPPEGGSRTRVGRSVVLGKQDEGVKDDAHVGVPIVSAEHSVEAQTLAEEQDVDGEGI